MGVQIWWTPYTTRVPPSTTLIFGRPRRLPPPRPFEADGRAAARIEVPHKFDICIFVQIRVGVELARYQILDLSGIGGVYVRQAADVGIENLGGARSGLRWLLRLSNDEGEGEGQLSVVEELEDEGWSSCRGRRVRILDATSQPKWSYIRGGLPTYLYEVYGTAVAQRPASRDLGGWECVWNDGYGRTPPRI